MTPIGTCRLYRPDPTAIGISERWGKAGVTAALEPAVVVSVRGEVDASNAAQLANYIERHVAIASALVVVDTSAVDFFGTPALAALHKVDRCCAASGVGWRLVVGPALRRVMRVCGTTDPPASQSLESAVRQLVIDRSSVAG